MADEEGLALQTRGKLSGYSGCGMLMDPSTGGPAVGRDSSTSTQRGCPQGRGFEASGHGKVKWKCRSFLAAARLINQRSRGWQVPSEAFSVLVGPASTWP